MALHRRIAFAGSLAQRPGYGGHAWVILQYLLGFRRLGYDVLFLDRLNGDMLFDAAGDPCTLSQSHNLQYFLEVMRRYELHDSFSLDYNNGKEVIGIPRSTVLEHVRQSSALINVMGYLHDEEILSCARRRVFLDIDPGFGQMWQALGLCEMFQGHDDYVTIGLHIGQPYCEIPTCGIDWITTLQPIVLEFWPAQSSVPRPRFTTVASWRGPYDAVEYNGRRYGLRVHEFRKYLELPRLTEIPFELALDIDPSDSADLLQIDKNSWRLISPADVAAYPWTYQEYVQNSWAEFSVAKEMYVQSHSGWISDRSICYLASGRPVLVQDTSLRDSFPVGSGLLVFSTLEEAAAGVQQLSANYVAHARAARDVVCEFFDSDKVIRRLLDRLGVNES